MTLTFGEEDLVMRRTASFSGTLPLDAIGALGADTRSSPEPPEPSLVTAIKTVLSTEDASSRMPALLEQFRAAELLVELPGEDEHAITPRRVEGLMVQPVFTDLRNLALFAQATGRADQAVHYGQLTGAELLDEVLSQLPYGTSMLIDPVSDHVFVLPPVSGIVPDSLALRRDYEVSR